MMTDRQTTTDTVTNPLVEASLRDGLIIKKLDKLDMQLFVYFQKKSIKKIYIYILKNKLLALFFTEKLKK